MKVLIITMDALSRNDFAALIEENATVEASKVEESLINHQLLGESLAEVIADAQPKDVESYNRTVFFAVKALDQELSKPKVLLRGVGPIELVSADGASSLVGVPEVLGILEDGCRKFPYLRHQVGDQLAALRKKYNQIVLARRTASAIGISAGAIFLVAGMFLGISSVLTTHDRDYTGVQWFNETKVGQDYSHSRFVGSYLSGSNLSRSNFAGANLRESKISGAVLNDVNFSGADLSFSDLTNSSLRGADLRKASLKGANLTGVDLRGASIEGADFTGAKLSGVSLDPGVRIAQ